MRPPTFTNVLLDHHIYSIFNDNIYLSHKDRLQYYCNQRSDISSANQYHYLVTGEWTTTPTDCAKYVNGRGIGARYDGSYPGFKSQGSCSSKTGSGANFSSTFKSQLKDLFDTQRNVYEKSGSGVSTRSKQIGRWLDADSPQSHLALAVDLLDLEDGERRRVVVLCRPQVRLDHQQPQLGWQRQVLSHSRTSVSILSICIYHFTLFSSCLPNTLLQWSSFCSKPPQDNATDFLLLPIMPPLCAEVAMK